MSPGSSKSGSSTSRENVGAGSWEHLSTNSSHVHVVPWVAQCCMHCCNSHIPFTFFRKLILPPMPPSLLKLLCRACLVRQGDSSTHPTSDHVPELINAQSFPCDG